MKDYGGEIERLEARRAEVRRILRFEAVGKMRLDLIAERAWLDHRIE